MDRWTCGCGRSNFTTAYPCVMCGGPPPAPTDRAAVEPAELIATLPARRWRPGPGLIIGGVVLSAAIAAVVFVGVRTQPERGTGLASDRIQAKPITPFATTTAPPANPLDVSLARPSHDFEETDADGLRNGPLTLADFDGADRTRLTSSHFTGGFSHVWVRRGGGDSLIKVVLEFPDEPAATEFFRGDTAGADAMPGSEIPGAVIGTWACGCDTIVQGIEFHKGNRVFFVAVGAVGYHFTPAEATAVALQQYTWA